MEPKIGEVYEVMLTMNPDQRDDMVRLARQIMEHNKSVIEKLKKDSFWSNFGEEFQDEY